MSLSDYFHSQAEWRRQKAQDYPEDERNVHSAEALESLAEYVKGDEDGGHEVESTLAALEPHLFEGVVLGGEESRRVVSRYGFGYRATTPTHHIDLLQELVVLCAADAYEFAGEHGDDPTETLLPCELEAARADVYLPRYYFERRGGSTERECEEAIAAYSAEPVVK